MSNFMLYVMLLCVSVVTCIALAAYAWRQSSVPGARAFAGATLSAGIWSLGYLFEFTAPSLNSKLLWYDIKNIGPASLPTFFLLFALQYTGREIQFTRPRALLASLPILGLLLAVWTNPWTGWWMTDVHISHIGNIAIMDEQHQPLFFLLMTYDYGLILCGVSLFVISYYRAHPIYRKQTGILLLGVLAAFMGSALNLIGYLGAPLDLTPIVFAFSLPILGWGIFRYQFLGTVPVARDIVFEKMLDGVIVTDPESRIVDINLAAQRMLGVAFEKTLNRPVMEVLPASFSQEGESDAEQVALCEAGEICRFCDVRRSPLHGYQDRLIGYLLLLHDVTERHRSEQELAKARDLALASARAKSEFLANMSHELRTPMHAIMGFAELLSETHLDTEQTEFVHTIRQSADFLLTILNDILDFSKMEAGKLQIVSRDFNLRVVMEGVTDLLSPKAQEKRLALHCRYPTGCPELLCGDEVRLRQILINLVANAIKFTEQGEVTLQGMLLEQTRDQIRLRLQVQDTGIGIPLDRQSAIFESFTQADGTTTRRYGGTGLGLTISNELVTLMGGSMGVQSEVGKGSLFWLELPFAKQKQLTDLSFSRDTGEPGELESMGSPPANEDQRPLSVPERNDADRLKGLRILLCEDNPVNQMFARGILERYGCIVKLAQTGLEGIQQWEAHPFDIILMDVQMPEMDGLQATEQIRQREQATQFHIPIIAMTAHALDSDRERCLQAGMNDYLSKPVQPDQMRQLLLNYAAPTNVSRN